MSREQLDAAIAARKAELEAEEAPRFQNREGETFEPGDAVYVQRMDGTWLHARVVEWFADACGDDTFAVDPKCLRAHDYVTVDSASPEHFTSERMTVRTDVVHVGSRLAGSLVAGGSRGAGVRVGSPGLSKHAGHKLDSH